MKRKELLGSIDEIDRQIMEVTGDTRSPRLALAFNRVMDSAAKPFDPWDCDDSSCPCRVRKLDLPCEIISRREEWVKFITFVPAKADWYPNSREVIRLQESGKLPMPIYE